MPVLTDFLSVPSTPKKNKTLSLERIKELNKQREVLDTFKQTFNLRIYESNNLWKKIYDKEKEIILNLFNLTNNVPKKFETSCLGNKLDYVIKLNKISNYPFVEIQQLKEIAEALSFVILPIQYVDIYEIFNMYKKADVNDYEGWYDSNMYSTNIKKAYDDFETNITNCVDYDLIAPQNFYILAPLSFYDAWEEVRSAEVYPKYFSSKLINISTTLGIMIPTQRNLYKIVDMNSQNIQEMKKAMDENFRMLKQSIEECHNHIYWVEKMMHRLNLKLENTELELQKLDLKQAKLEKMLYCLLDPIIFSIDADVDISKVEANDKLARVGLCFGPEMPVDFFVENGLQTVFDKRFKNVTKILHPHIEYNSKEEVK